MFTFPFWLRVLSALSLSLALSTAFGQTPAVQAPSIKFGKIDPGQFVNTATDSTAEAVVLYDLGDVRFEVSNNEIWTVFTHHIRTLIRKKSGYERATLSLGARRTKAGKHEVVSSIDGYTYNLVDGVVKVDRLNKSGRFTERVSDAYLLEKYTLPNVREGSIIDYQYTIRTPFSVSHSPRTWRFQRDIPVNWSEYRIAIPDYFYYKMIMGGYLSLALNERKTREDRLLPGYDGSASIYRFAVKNAPAFRDEAYITTDEDYLSKIDFELASYTFPTQPTQNFSLDWDSLDKTLLADSDFGRQYNRASFLRETAKSILDQHKDSLARITAAYNFVRQSIKWTGESAFSCESLKKVFDNKKGDAGDINLLLVALLREMDVDANPVILSTRDHGRISEAYALIKRFNYVVAHVSIGGKDMLLDATDPYLKPGVLPIHCLNGMGRLISATGSRFIPLTPVDRESEVHSGRFSISEDGNMVGTLDHVKGGYDSWRARKGFATQGQAKYLDDIRKEHSNWQIDKAIFTNASPMDDSFKATYTLTIPEACSQAGDRLYFRPMLTEGRSNNPFKEPKRLYPVDLAVPMDETYSAVYTLPKGFEVEELPKTASLTLPNNGGRFIYQIALLPDNQLQVVSRFSLRQPAYSADDYPALRELFNLVVAKHAEQVVLKRTTLAEKK
ncbi:transglutaminase domain-containing protein [Spirosoma pomorum]